MAAPRILINALSMSEGGGRSYIVNLLRELGRDDRGFRFTLLTQRGGLNGIDPCGVEVAELNLPDRAARVVWRVAYEEAVLPFVARSHDLLYCVADLVPRFAAVPTVVLVRNLNIYDRRWYDDARTRTLERLVRFGMPGASRVIFPSRAAADLIAPGLRVSEERIRVVHYGISLDAFDQGSAAPAPSTRYLFLAAAVEKHKNIEVLVDCLSHVSDPELEVWIAGHSLLDPEHRGALVRRAEAAGMGHRVRFLGPVPYRDVLAYYRHCAAFVFPSYIETFGHPLLEAMVVGAPVIASDIPAFREIAGDAALFFPPDDPRSLARCVEGVTERSEEARRRIEAGRERVARFTWQASVDGLCSVFDEAVVGERRV